MKKAFLFVFGVLTFAACSKNNDPAPADITGTYQITRLTLPSLTGVGDTTITFPYKDPQLNQTLTGAVYVNRVTSQPNTILLTYNLGIQGTQSSANADTLGSLEIRNVGGNTYDMYGDNVKVGSLDGINFTLDFRDTTGADISHYAITAKK